MRKYLGFMFIITLLVLSGCSDQTPSIQKDMFSESDKCIVNIQTSQTLCYGDSRAAIESILKDNGDGGQPIVMYPSGLRIAYRVNIAVGFQLTEGSKEVYSTTRGAHIGMNKTEIMSLYGSKYALEITEQHLDYAYDMKTESYVDATQLFSVEVQNKREQVFLVSAMFDGNSNGTSSVIMLMDQKMAIFLE